jgi:hypothetical protein
MKIYFDKFKKFSLKNYFDITELLINYFKKSF